MSEEVDYKKVLADAEAEIARLQAVADEIAQLQAVAAFARKKLGLAAETPIAIALPAAPATQLTGTTIPSDAFFRMNPREAIRKYLGIVKQPKSATAITDALEKGGLPSKSQNLYTTVYAALRRGQGEIFSQVKKDWGLSEWYR